MFEIIVDGIPTPQKQTQFFRMGGRLRAYDASSKEKKRFQWRVQPHAPKEPLTCPIKLELFFHLPVPKSTSKVRSRQMLNRTIQHVKKPDVDNLAYFVTNALKKIFYEDDSQIVDLYMHKCYHEIPKTIIQITPIHQIEPTRGDS